MADRSRDCASRLEFWIEGGSPRLRDVSSPDKRDAKHRDFGGDGTLKVARLLAVRELRTRGKPVEPAIARQVIESASGYVADQRKPVAWMHKKLCLGTHDERDCELKWTAYLTFQSSPLNFVPTSRLASAGFLVGDDRHDATDQELLDLVTSASDDSPQDSEYRFQSWMLDLIARRAEDARTAVRTPTGSGPALRPYVKAVQNQLKGFDGIVLALCGEKGLDEPSSVDMSNSRDYYDRFFNWAGGLTVRGAGPLTVCRIFVRKTQGSAFAFTPQTQTIIGWHKHHEAHGVRALVFRDAERGTLNRDFPHIGEELGEGFGAVVFLDPRSSRATALVHAGVGRKFTYWSMQRRLTVVPILELLDFLTRNTEEYRDPAIRPQLDEILAIVGGSGD